MNDKENIDKELEDLGKLSECILRKMTEEAQRIESENIHLKTTVSGIRNLINEEKAT